MRLFVRFAGVFSARNLLVGDAERNAAEYSWLYLRGNCPMGSVHNEHCNEDGAMGMQLTAGRNGARPGLAHDLQSLLTV